MLELAEPFSDHTFLMQCPKASPSKAHEGHDKLQTSEVPPRRQAICLDATGREHECGVLHHPGGDRVIQRYELADGPYQSNLERAREVLYLLPAFSAAPFALESYGAGCPP